MAVTPSEVDITAGSGTHISTVDITNGGNTDKRQVTCIGGPNTADLNTIASVISILPASSELGLTVRNASLADVTATINLTANAQTASVAMNSHKSVAVVLTGTWVATIVFEISVDGTTWVACNGFSEANGNWVPSTTAVGSWWFEPLGAIAAARIRVSAYTSGTITGILLASTGDANTFEFQGEPGVSIPTNAVLLGGSDGTNLRAITTDTTGIITVHKIPSSSSTFAPSAVDSTALEAGHVIKASAGTLYSLSGYNSKTGPQFILIFNSTTVPADTTVPIIVLIVPQQSNFSWDAGQYGKAFSTGISVSNSSTAATKTAGAADCWFNALFS